MNNTINWRDKHYSIMSDFIKYINNISNKFILKGGTSLMLCYGLTRFSEDIDLDGFDKNFIKIVDKWIQRHNDFTYRVGKNTDTFKRVFIHYGGKNH